MLPLAFSVWVRNTGRRGYSISVEISANRLAAASKKMFFDSPARGLWTTVFAIDPPRSCSDFHQRDAGERADDHDQ